MVTLIREILNLSALIDCGPVGGTANSTYNLAVPLGQELSHPASNCKSQKLSFSRRQSRSKDPEL